MNTAAMRRARRVGSRDFAGFRLCSSFFLRLAILGLAVPLVAAAQFGHPQSVSVRSASGQFTVHAAPPPAEDTATAKLAERENYLTLDPALTAVSCERIKRAVADLLGADSRWRGRITLVLYPAQTADDDATIVSERSRDGWNYRLELPNPIERTRYVRSVVIGLLLERAGRHARERSPEIPVWLAEGLVQHLLQARARELLLPPPRRVINRLALTPVIVDERRRDPLETARRVLRESRSAGLTVADLSWPTAEQLAGDAGEAYRCSAQLFVAELLRLKDGRACLRAMLDGLANCYNWQTAFLRAFHAHFPRLVDLEKWWALQLVHFTGHDPALAWSPEETWQKLDELLRTPVEVRQARNELPARAQLPLATVIREWDFLRQSQTLHAKLRALDFARPRASRDLAGLVEDYRRWLADYLARRSQPGMVQPPTKTAAPGAKAIVREALRQLEKLEARRAALRPRTARPVAAQAATDPTASP